MVSTLKPPDVVGIPDQDYCYKSVATQIPHDWHQSALPEIKPGTSAREAVCATTADELSKLICIITLLVNIFKQVKNIL